MVPSVTRADQPPGRYSSPDAGGLFPTRYVMLDAWRGLAALAVVVHHVAHVYIGGPAVMVFFVISGYCISAAAESCRAANLGVRTFLWRRARRIFPPYLAALAFWAATRGLKAWRGGENQLTRSAAEWLQNLTLTQWISLVPEPAAYPARNPTLFVGAFWSLGYEEQFYLVMAGLVAAGSVSLVLSRWLVVALLAGGLAWNVVFPTKVFGVFLEYWAPFAMGCLVHYRLCGVGSRRARMAIDVGVLLVTLGAGAIFWTQGGFPEPDANGDEFRSVAGELLVAGAFALTLVALRRADGSFAASAWGRPLRALGAITFSLYLVHQFNLNAAIGVSRFFARPESLLGCAIQVVFLLGVGSVFWWCCERPFLNKKPAAERQG